MPEETYSTLEIKKVDPNFRACNIGDDLILHRQLKYTSIPSGYAKSSYANCILDCRLITLLEKCQCFPFYYDRKGLDVCTLHDVECIKEHKCK
ncbi:hypothetical protein KQX54_005967 [Cotesia glomerata]|uniref:Uncharacterized protein n=1 Tax=Cotesia glomerata TaxID=32391 RepID=A0AAV7ILF0_COTGL|nr:hypothetical protein KQX54_005967 [Cotesia glomerata]